MFDNWINNSLVHIDDNLSENKSNLVKYKADWISEFICLK